MSENKCTWQVGSREHGSCWREAATHIPYVDTLTRKEERRLLCWEHAEELNYVHMNNDIVPKRGKE